MNLANKLSMFRIFIIPVILLFMLPAPVAVAPENWNSFVLSGGSIVAGILFVIASISDYLDGQIARKYNLVTNLGKFLDALADKMLVVSVLIALVALHKVSSVMVIIIVFREFTVTGIRLLASEKGVVIAAKMLGKIKTVTQMSAIIFILFEPLFIKLLGASNAGVISGVSIVGDVLFYICVLMTIISGIDYFMKNLSYFRE